MFAYAAIPLTCWLCALLATPRKPRVGNEVEELVYSRLLGRQQMVALLALLVTAAAVLAIVVTLPQRLDPDLNTVRQAHAACVEARQVESSARDGGATVLPHCLALQPGGTWAEQMERADGSWLLVATLASPPVYRPPHGSLR